MPYVISDAVREPLYAIVPYFNPWRWKSREKHTIRAIKHFMDSGAVVVLVEAAFNRREFAFQNSGLDGTLAQCGFHDKEFRHKHIGLQTTDELWLKENLVEKGVESLPHDWQQACMLDSDIHFLRPNWVGETIHRLQHYSWLQMFSQARDLSPEYELMPEGYPHAAGVSFVHAHVEGLLEQSLSNKGVLSVKLDLTTPEVPYPPPSIWPGLAWAFTRKGYEATGGLITFAVWGGADWHMSHCLIGRQQGMMRNDLHPIYKDMVTEWFDRCEWKIRRNVGVMSGVVTHHWHGRKVARGYNTKHALLARAGFNPVQHLRRNYQGLWQLHDDGSDAYLQLRDMMRKVAKGRQEDSSDTRVDLWEQGH